MNSLARENRIEENDQTYRNQDRPRREFEIEPFEWRGVPGWRNTLTAVSVNNGKGVPAGWAGFQRHILTAPLD